MKNPILFFFLEIFVFNSLFTSCSDVELVEETDSMNSIDVSDIVLNCDSTKTYYFVEFAKCLSKLTYESQDVREFIKEEALTEFDKNNDVLWLKVQDQIIDGKTFRNYFEEISSASFINEVEERIPLLNVLFPENIIANVGPETYDSSDDILPVVLLGKNVYYIFFNGNCTDTIPYSEVPEFNVLILNENNRVRIESETRSSGLTYSFVDPIFDNVSKCTRSAEDKVSQIVSQDYLGERTKKAAKYFYSNEEGPYNKGYQRDYIYYNVYPEHTQGSYVRSASEYINFIMVQPSLYAVFADDKAGNKEEKDMIINEYEQSITKEKGPYSEYELLEKFWTIGNYCFHIVVSTSEMVEAFDEAITVDARDLWNFNIYTRKTQHRTMFRRSKYTSTINIRDFTPKMYYLQKLLELGKWDIAKEASNRHVYIYEYDRSEETTISETYDFTVERNSMIDTKGSYTYKKDGNEASASAEWKYETSKKEHVTRTITRKYQTGSDNIGKTQIMYNDPIIEKIDNGNYYQHIYTVGNGFSFGVVAF